MSNPENEQTSQMNESFHPGQQPDPMKSAINPPPPMYGETSPSQKNESFHPGQQPEPMKSAINPPPPMYGATSPSMPYQYQPYAGPPGAVPMQPQQTIFVTNVQSVNEPDYLGYSIFTLLCCCLPLGVAALIYSIRTQEANQRGDITSAKRYSRLALTLDHTALGLGIAWIVLVIILVIVFNTVVWTTYATADQSSFGNYKP